MKRRYTIKVLGVFLLAALCAAGVPGCSQDAGPNRAPTAQDMRADSSKMNADQRKMMQEGMQRDAERMKNAAANRSPR